MKALIIEHSRTYNLALSVTLDSYGFAYDCVDNTDDAVAMAKYQQYDLICIARQFLQPKNNRLCTLLRAQRHNITTPIIMFSGTEVENIQPFMSAGVTEVFHKADSTALNGYLHNLCLQLNSQRYIGSKILYIEDLDSAAKSIISLLSAQGYEVQWFKDAEQALAAFQQQSFHLVISDVVIGGKMNGLSLVRAIRRHEQGKNIPTPIMAMSGFDDSPRKLALYKAGINEYLSKPILEEEFLVRVENLLLNQQLLRRLEFQQQQLQAIAMTDQLTGIHNRHFLMDSAQQKIAHARRYGQALSMVVIDVDHFKAINDRYGHDVGDKTLIAIAQCLKRLCRQEDTLARFGGEEFVMLMEACSLQDALHKAEQIKQQLNALRPHDIPVTASFGIAQRLEEESDFSQLFARADKAVYEAKAAGRNCCRVADLDCLQPLLDTSCQDSHWH